VQPPTALCVHEVGFISVHALKEKYYADPTDELTGKRIQT